MTVTIQIERVIKREVIGDTGNMMGILGLVFATGRAVDTS